MFKPALGAGGDGVERFTMPEDDGDAPARPTKRARRSEEASAAPGRAVLGDDTAACVLEGPSAACRVRATVAPRTARARMRAGEGERVGSLLPGAFEV